MSNTKIWVISIMGIICGWLLVVSAASLAPVFWSLSMAYFIFPLVLLLEKKLRIRRIIAVALAMLVILGVFVVLFSSVLPLLINQMMVFAREISAYSLRFVRLVDQLQAYLDGLGLDSRVSGSLDDVLGQVLTMIGNAAREFVSSVLGVVSRAADIVIVIILLFYFLLDGQRMTE